MGRRSLKEVRQKEIVKAFYTVAKNEGLEKTSIAKVAGHMQINPSLVIHYFKSKYELELALIDYISERYLNIYSTEGEIKTVEELLDLIDKLFSKRWNQFIDYGIYYSCYAMPSRNKEFISKFKQMQDSLRGMFQQSLQDAYNHGVINNSDIEKLAGIIFSLLEGAYLYLGLVTDQKEYDMKMEYYKQHVIKILELN